MLKRYQASNGNSPSPTGTWSSSVYKASHHKELILMSAIARVLVMIDEATASKLKALPLSDNTTLIL